MKFVDKASINIQAGSGGPGAISFRKEKYVPKGGPSGGNGGNGGNIILEATNKLQTLMDLKIRHNYKAPNGMPGKNKDQTGAKGNDSIIRVPIGTIVFNTSQEIVADLKKEGDRFIAAYGGKGGRGNASYATSTNRAPRKAQDGLPGENTKAYLELRLIADIGLVGLPNAGKSTLLKTLTMANPKIANYPFTTLYPNLGVLKFIDKEIIIADIPGLIEGASDGQGLGFDFLRHIDRTHFLIHLVPTSLETPEKCWDQFETVNNELKKSELKLENKTTIVALTKIDLLSTTLLEEIVLYFNKKGIKPIAFSSFTEQGIPLLIKKIQKVYQDNEQT
jgi:GTPase